MTQAKIIEDMARAICRAHGWEWDFRPIDAKQTYRRMARAALGVARSLPLDGLSESKESETPDWEDLRGVAPNATGDKSSEAFIRDLRDGWGGSSKPSAPAPVQAGIADRLDLIAHDLNTSMLDDIIVEVRTLAQDRDELEQTSAELCERCGWRMKFPNEPCRNCECEDLRARLTAAQEALRPFADIGVGTNPDYEPMIRLPREAILRARAALSPAPQPSTEGEAE